VAAPFFSSAAFVLLPLLAGSLVYCILVVLAARRYLAVRPAATYGAQPVSILKPLSGVDEGLEDNLRSFFRQQYSCPFEILFALRSDADPAVAIVRRLMTEFPDVPAELCITGEPPYANAKVFSLDHMLRRARYDLLVMSDSDIRVTPDMLQRVSAEFRDSGLGVATCPYRAVPGRSFWSKLEAVGMNTEFLSGILVARMLEGMKFAVGPTIVARRKAIEAIGGFDRLKDFLAEDFVLGKFAAEAGFGVVLSAYVIEHRIGSQALLPNFRHRLRWNRSTRRSRPAGYVGQLFTNPIPLVLLLWMAEPAWWPLVALTLLLRAWAAAEVGGRVLRDRLVWRQWWLVPLQDLLSFVFWLAGFFGNTVTWRGRKYYLFRDGRFAPVAHPDLSAVNSRSR
jgi:ceramide glucosyltransferase